MDQDVDHSLEISGYDNVYWQCDADFKGNIPMFFTASKVVFDNCLNWIYLHISGPSEFEQKEENHNKYYIHEYECKPPESKESHHDIGFLFEIGSSQICCKHVKYAGAYQEQKYC